MTSVYADTSYETIERLRQHQDYREIKSSISRPLQNLVEMYSTTTIAGEKYRFNSERPSGEIEKFNGAERGWGVVFSLADFGIDCNRWFIKSIIPSPTSSRIAGVGTASLPGNLPILVSMTLILIAICLCVASPEIRSLQRGTEWAVAENKN